MGIKTLAFHIKPAADLEFVWQYLEESGCVLLYSNSEENEQQIFGDVPSRVSKDDLLDQCSEILSIAPIELPEIDWEVQWAAHEHYRDGFLHVDLHHYAQQILFDRGPSILKLIPGPGFGDLSHPTTRLVLRLMPPYVQNKPVIDMGCGSGVLSIAAVSMGAATVCGLDIDPQALVHSRDNSACNEMRGEIDFLLPEEVKKVNRESVMLMNMIQSEQEVAWKSLASFSNCISIAVTSGILVEGRADYLKQCSMRGWQLIEELEEEGWLGFVFSLNVNP